MGKCSYYLMKGSDYNIEAENVACPGSISQVGFPMFRVQTIREIGGKPVQMACVLTRLALEAGIV